MIKQKIAQFRELWSTRKDKQEKEAQSLAQFKEWLSARGEIIKTKDRHVSSAWRRPNDDLFGTLNYPCIVNHSWDMSFSFGDTIVWESDIEHHCCKSYVEQSECQNQDCFWYAKNKAVADAWEKWQSAANESENATKKYMDAYRAFFGERRYKRVYGK
ncbi:MAG: hypothetical protein J6T57_00830 [Alphaproteobacteria bacterium]|nr:hypothetical protein [Alphaproteobacteria bacterium]